MLVMAAAMGCAETQVARREDTLDTRAVDICQSSAVAYDMRVSSTTEPIEVAPDEYMVAVESREAKGQRGWCRVDLDEGTGRIL